jgi:putative ABC transport system permease protein
MDRLIQDLRYALRTFIRQPVVTVTAIAALALGIGANTAVFSVVYGVLLKPLPYPDPDALIYVHDSYPAVRFASVGFAKYLALREGNRTLDALGAMAPVGLTLTGAGAEPEQVPGSRVSADLFRTMRVEPLHGRWFAADEDQPGGAPVIVLGHALWARRFGADPRVVGSPITIDGQARTVTGVMPPGFTYPGRTEAWVPLAMSAAPTNTSNFLRLVGRLRPGTSVEQARADLETVTAAFNDERGLTRGIMVWRLHDITVESNRRTLLVLQGAVAFVLLIACANVANLLLARSVARRRELAIRTALGAARWRIVRQLLTESVLLSIVGAGTGLVLAGWLLRLFKALAPATFPRAASLQIDSGVLVFTVAVAVLTGLLFGVAPARRGIRTDPNDALRDASGRGASSASGRGASRTLVVAEVSLAVVLVVGAALMVKSLVRLQRQDTGFRAENVVTFDLNLPRARYETDRIVTAAYERLMEEIRTVPGVQAAGAINHVPLVRFGFNGAVVIEGQPQAPSDKTPVVELRVVMPGYFDAMGVPVRAGRGLTAQDTAAGQPVVVINEAMARQFWPGQNPVGARIRPPFLDTGSRWFEVVGVVGDVRSWTLRTPPVPECYTPFAQAPVAALSPVIRTGDIPVEAVLPAIRQRIAAIDPALPLVRVQTLTTVIEQAAGDSRLSSVLTTVFALLAAVLATVGIYSVISYSVAQRHREIGIRVALGADSRRITRLVLGEGLLLAGIGVGLGALAAIGLTRTLGTMLYEVSPTDPAVLAGTVGGVVLVALAASYLPARRATRVDPAIALRAE